MSFADVTSANVVGYNNIQLLDGGTRMLGPCFVSVGNTEKVKLSELKIVGYEQSTEFLMEMGFSVTFQIRASNGMPSATYEFADASDDMETWNGGKWYDFDTKEEITSDNDILLNPGDGLWMTAPELKVDCSGFYLTSAGQVLKGDQAFELLAGGTIGVCNMLPAPTTLSKIEIHGYEDSAEFLMEMGFSVTMQSLGSDGMPLATYEFADASDDMETWNGGKWYDFDTKEEITSDNDVTIIAGEGFWATSPDLKTDTEEFVFVIPKVLD